MTLAQSIHELTRPHLPAGATLNTEPVPPLLDQIEHAAKPDTGGGASGGSDEPKIPIDVGAISLLQDITTAARDEHYELFGHHTGTLHTLIQAFAQVEHQEWVDYLERVTTEWVTSITNYLNPTKPPYRPAVPCPACHILYDTNGTGPGLRIHCWGEDEEMIAPGEWSAECIHCGAAWEAGGEGMKWLRASLNMEPAM